MQERDDPRGEKQAEGCDVVKAERGIYKEEAVLGCAVFYFLVTVLNAQESFYKNDLSERNYKILPYFTFRRFKYSVGIFQSLNSEWSCYLYKGKESAPRNFFPQIPFDHLHLLNCSNLCLFLSTDNLMGLTAISFDSESPSVWFF